jgi:hypothetical protein
MAAMVVSIAMILIQPSIAILKTPPFLSDLGAFGVSASGRMTQMPRLQVSTHSAAVFKPLG